jgi:hypothetical protein
LWQRHRKVEDRLDLVVPENLAEGADGCKRGLRATPAALLQPVQEFDLHQRRQAEQHHAGGIVSGGLLGSAPMVEVEVRMVAPVAPKAIVMDAAEPPTAVGRAGACGGPAFPK